MVEVGRIREIWRYPVKSMAGERVPAAELSLLGVHADRMWAVRDRATDVTIGAKRLSGLLSCTARFAAPPPPDAGPGTAAEVLITFPDGTEVSSSDPGVHAALSGYLDRDVELRPLPPVTDPAQYRAGSTSYADTRAMLGLDPGEPFPDMSMFPLRKLAELGRYATPVGSYVDAYPVHLVTAESLRTVARAAPGSDFDVRRFRPTVVVETGSSADFPEWEWCGGVLHAPNADLRPEIPTIRCVMTSHEQPGLAKDRDVTRALAATSNRCLGVYGSVARPGRIAVGDPLDLESVRRSPLTAAAGTAGTRVKRALMHAASAVMPKGS